MATAMPERLLEIADERLGLRALFDGRVYTLADVAGRSKPEPDLFLFAADRLGVRPEACVVIEDAPYGIEAARRAGMRSVALTTTYGREHLADADRVVERFADIDLTATALHRPLPH